MTMPARVRSCPAGSIRPACISRRSLLPITQVMNGKMGQVMISPNKADQDEGPPMGSHIPAGHGTGGGGVWIAARRRIMTCAVTWLRVGGGRRARSQNGAEGRLRFEGRKQPVRRLPVAGGSLAQMAVGGNPSFLHPPFQIVKARGAEGLLLRRLHVPLGSVAADAERGRARSGNLNAGVCWRFLFNGQLGRVARRRRKRNGICRCGFGAAASSDRRGHMGDMPTDRAAGHLARMFGSHPQSSPASAARDFQHVTHGK